MKIIALGSDIPNTKQDDFTPYLDHEARRVDELMKEGYITEIYFRADRRDAVIMLECQDIDQANALLQTLPLVQRNLITFELIPLASYTGFERLFVKNT